MILKLKDLINIEDGEVLNIEHPIFKTDNKSLILSIRKSNYINNKNEYSIGFSVEDNRPLDNIHKFLGKEATIL